MSLGKFSGRNYAIVEVKGKESREDVIRRVGRVIERKYSTKVTKFQKYETRRERAMREGGQNLVRERERREEESRKAMRERERENGEHYRSWHQQPTERTYREALGEEARTNPRQQQENHGPWHKGNMNDFFHQVGNKENHASHHRREWAYREDLARKMEDWNALQGLLRKLNLDPVTSTTPASTSLTSSTSAPFPYKLTTARYANGWGSSSRNPARL